MRYRLAGAALVALLFAASANSHATLIGDWVGDDYTSGNWTDRVSSIVGSAVGSPSFVTSGFNGHRAVALNGSSGFNLSPNPMAGFGDFTITAVVGTTMAGAGSTGGDWWNSSGIVGMELGGGNRGDYGIVFDSGSGFKIGHGNPDVVVRSTSGYNDGRPHVVTYAYHYVSGSSSLALYVDGTSLGVATQTGMAVENQPMYFGRTSVGGAFFTGNLAEIRMDNTTLSSAAVYSLQSNLATTYGVALANPLVPVLHYAMDAAPVANVVADATGKNNGTNSGATYAAGAGIRGGAMSFNGANSQIIVPYSAMGDFSMSLWMKTTVAGPTGTPQWYTGFGLFDGEVAGVANDFGLALYGSSPMFGVGNPDASITTAFNVIDGQWHQVVVTRENASGVMDLYVDGVLRSTATGAAGIRTGPTRLVLGSLQTNVGYFSGLLDDVQLYNAVLDPTSVGLLYANPGYSLDALVPEPATLSLLALGALALLRRRQRSH